jgi:putative ABC transport system permease protein
MTMLQGFQIALHALRLNPLRSILTMLGIVIGVASIVTVFAIGSGAQLRLQEQIRSIGANVLMITPGAVYQGGVRLKDGSKLTMTESDVQAILEQIPEIQAAAGSIAGTAQVIHESKLEYDDQRHDDRALHGARLAACDRALFFRKRGGRRRQGRDPRQHGGA